jgi:hypothetical protein
VQHRSQPQKPAARLLQAASNLDAEALLGKRPWESWILNGLKSYPNAARPDDKSDVLHDANRKEKVIQHPSDPNRRTGQPRVHRGAIASADTLQKNPAQRDARAMIETLPDEWFP